MAARKVVNDFVDEEVVEEKPVKDHVYKKTELIPCKSICSGVLCLIGPKTGDPYRWPSYGAIEEVEYQDLIYWVHAHKPSVFKPRFLILDDEFVRQNPVLQEIYDSMYSVRDLHQVINMPIAQMKKTIASMPDGIKESLKDVAANMFETHQLDSVQKIKAIDELLGTNILMTLTQE